MWLPNLFCTLLVKFSRTGHLNVCFILLFMRFSDVLYKLHSHILIQACIFFIFIWKKLPYIYLEYLHTFLAFQLCQPYPSFYYFCLVLLKIYSPALTMAFMVPLAFHFCTLFYNGPLHWIPVGAMTFFLAFFPN